MVPVDPKRITNKILDRLERQGQAGMVVLEVVEVPGEMSVHLTMEEMVVPEGLLLV